MDGVDDLVAGDRFAHLAHADRLDAVVDRLAVQVCVQRTEKARSSLASYLYAHAQVARALRERVAGEDAESAERMREAVQLLENVEGADFVIA